MFSTRSQSAVCRQHYHLSPTYLADKNRRISTKGESRQYRTTVWRGIVPSIRDITVVDDEDLGQPMLEIEVAESAASDIARVCPVQ